MPKRHIHIDFQNFSSDFDRTHNPIADILEKRYDLVFSTRPEFLFYSCFGPVPRQKDCVKIYVSGESDIPDFNLCDYAIAFPRMRLGTRYFRYDIYDFDFERLSRSSNDRGTSPRSVIPKRFCNFIYSNTNPTAGVRHRAAFCRALMRYKAVDCPGRVLHNYDAPDFTERNATSWREGKIRFLERYKFTIAFENASLDGYMTEKMWQPLLAGSVPIYWGDPNASTMVNPEAFINAHTFKTLDELVDRIRYLDTHDEEYLKMRNATIFAPGFDPLALDSAFENFLYDIIERGNNPFDKDPSWHSPYLFAQRSTLHRISLARRLARKITNALNLS